MLLRWLWSAAVSADQHTAGISPVSIEKFLRDYYSLAAFEAI